MNKYFNSWLMPMLVIFIWVLFMYYSNLFGLYEQQWKIALAMLFGSFIAGSTSVGGGTIGYPVLVLVFGATPLIGRDFSLFVQAIGMSMAMFAIIFSRQKVKWGIVYKALLPGVIGLHVGFILIPLIPSSYLKITFAVLWMSFLVHLFISIKKESAVVSTPLKQETFLICLFSFLGGLASGLVGSGIDMLIFIVMTQRFKIGYKVATRTSIVLMALLSIYATLYRIGIDNVLQNTLLVNMWLVCIPIVAIGAPLGTLFVQKYDVKFLKTLLYFIIVLEIFISHIVIKSTPSLLIYEFVLFALFYLILHYMSNPRISKTKLINSKTS